MQAIKDSTVSLPRAAQSTAPHGSDCGTLRTGMKCANPRFTDNEDGTVTDNLTGLIWLKDADSAHGTKNWRDALAFTNKLANGYCGLSDGSKAGDWRLPNVNELRRLIEYGKSDPALSNGWTDSKPFTNLRSNYYWTTTTVSGNPSRGWMVYLSVGNRYDKPLNSAVWPVRSGQ